MQFEGIDEKSKYNKFSFQKSSWVTKALGISLAANIVLSLFSLIEWHETGYLMLHKFYFSPHTEEMAAVPATGSLKETLVQMKQKSFDELQALLQDESVQYEGYRTRDLALSILASSHQLNVKKPLTGSLAIKEERLVDIEGSKIALFPGFSPEQFLALTRYLQEERFPFTAEGLFLRLAQNQEDEALKTACRLTPEYLALETLFKNDLASNELFSLATDAGFNELSSYFESQKKGFSTAVQKKREFLVRLLQRRSKRAAELLVKLDRDFAIQRLEDKDVLLVLTLLDNPSGYAQALLKGHRKDEIQKRALAVVQKTSPQLVAKNETAVKGATSSKKEIKTSVSLAAAQGKSSKMARVPTAKVASQSKPYVVQSGDNLWRISKKFHVAINDIKRMNQLRSDDLKPGTVLSIPQ